MAQESWLDTEGTIDTPLTFGGADLREDDQAEIGHAIRCSLATDVQKLFAPIPEFAKAIEFEQEDGTKLKVNPWPTADETEIQNLIQAVKTINKHLPKLPANTTFAAEAGCRISFTAPYQDKPTNFMAIGDDLYIITEERRDSKQFVIERELVHFESELNTLEQTDPNNPTHFTLLTYYRLFDSTPTSKCLEEFLNNRKISETEFHMGAKWRTKYFHVETGKPSLEVTYNLVTQKISSVTNYDKEGSWAQTHYLRENSAVNHWHCRIENGTATIYFDALGNPMAKKTSLNNGEEAIVMFDGDMKPFGTLSMEGQELGKLISERRALFAKKQPGGHREEDGPLHEAAKKFLLKLAQELDSDEKIAFFCDHFFTYVFDSPNPSNPLEAGSKTKYGEYVQTALETLKRVKDGKMEIDCDDIAVFAVTIKRIQAHLKDKRSLAQVLGVPGHAFALWVDKHRDGTFTATRIGTYGFSKKSGYKDATTAIQAAIPDKKLGGAIEIMHRHNNGAHRYIYAPLEILSDPKAHKDFFRAFTAFDEGKHDEALKGFGKLAQDYPDSSAPAFSLGLVHDSQGDHDRARAEFRIAFNLGHRDSFNKLAPLLPTKKQKIDYFNEALKIPSIEISPSSCQLVADGVEETSAKILIFKQAITRYPEKPQLYLHLAKIYDQVGDALKVFETAQEMKKNCGNIPEDINSKFKGMLTL